MSLRLRINLLMFGLFALVLVLGTILVIHNARQAIESETHSTARLTLNLLELAIANTSSPKVGDLESRLARQISEFEQTRHLQIAVLIGGDTESAFDGETRQRDVIAPVWFVRLVSPEILELRRTVKIAQGDDIEIFIRADPFDEIAESWKESRSLLGLLLLFSILSIVTVYISTGRWLKPIVPILGALEGIERGDYASRLPRFDLPELDAVAQNFNHMAGILDDSREETRQLTQQAIRIREQERRHLARELHDEMGQSVTAIKAIASSISKQQEDLQPESRQSASMIVDISSRMYDVVRDMMKRLSPVVLEELGLVPAIQQIIDDWNFSHQDMFCKWCPVGDLEHLGDEMNICIYRIIQEALTNVVKHASATEVTVKLINQTNNVQLYITDDGSGFDLGTVRRSIGLKGIEERIEVLDGKFSLVTSPGEGVNLDVSLPLTGQ